MSRMNRTPRPTSPIPPRYAFRSSLPLVVPPSLRGVWVRWSVAWEGVRPYGGH